MENNLFSTDSEFINIRDPSGRMVADNTWDGPYSVDHAVLLAQSKPNLMKQLVRDVIEKKLHGNDESYHKLIELCEQIKDHDDAFRLCKYALGKIKYSPLLICDIIEIGTSFENPLSKCGMYVDRLRGTEDYWNLRLFQVVFRYYYKLVSNNTLQGQFVPAYTSAREIARKLQLRFCWNEEGYYDEALLLILVGERDEAQHKLEDWFYYPLDADKDSERYLRCPRCCRLWFEEFRERNGNWTFCNYVVAKGIREAEREEDLVFFTQQMEYISRIINHGGDAYRVDALRKNKQKNSIDTYNKQKEY